MGGIWETKWRGIFMIKVRLWGCEWVHKYLADWSRLEDGAVSGWIECFYLFEEEGQEEEEEGDIFWLVPLLQLFSGLLRLLPERICFAARYFSPLLDCDAWCCHNCKDLQKFWNRAMLLTFGKPSVNLFLVKIRFILILLLEMRCTCVILICQIVSSWGQNKLWSSIFNQPDNKEIKHKSVL